jgi:hypothetical protein
MVSLRRGLENGLARKHGDGGRVQFEAAIAGKGNEVGGGRGAATQEQNIRYRT